MHIVFCTDTNYVMPCGVAMISVCENNIEEDITFHVIFTDDDCHTNIENDNLQHLCNICSEYGKKIAFYRLAKEKISHFFCSNNNHINVSTYSRFFIPDLLPSDINKILYLDCDLVCNGCLKDVWETELDADCPLGATVDFNYASTALHLQCGMPQSSYYFNAGVMLINLGCWRKNNYMELVINTALKNKFPLMDQDTLNNVFHGKVKFFSVKYNVQTNSLFLGLDACHTTKDYYFEIKEAYENPLIVHYVALPKPWHKELCPKREIWEKYFKKSIWKDKEYADVIVRFERSYLYKELSDLYWVEPKYFRMGLAGYFRFYRAAVKLKNKYVLWNISNFAMNTFASLLEKVYYFKTK